MTFAFQKSICMLEKHSWIRVKHFYLGVKAFHLFLKFISYCFPTRVFFGDSFVVILILRKHDFFINCVYRLPPCELFEMNVFVTKIASRLFYCRDAIFWSWHFPTIPLRFFLPRIEGLLVCGCWNIWCWWGQRRGAREKGRGAFSCKNCSFSFVSLKILLQTSSDCSSLEICGFLSSC